MHILVVSQYFWPENFRVNDLVKEWAERGHKVTVLTGIPNYPTGKVFYDYQINPTAFKNFNGARIIRVPIMPRGNSPFRLLLNYVSFVLSGSIFGFWCLRGVRVDVIFVFGASPVTVGMPAIFFGKSKRAPVVFWVLDLWPETLGALGVVRSPLILKLIGQIVRLIYSNCTLVLGQSRGFLDSIAKYCAKKEKIYYFPSWAEEIFADCADEPAVEVAINGDKFNIVFAGNIGESQDMPAILKAAEILKKYSNIRWIIVGDGRKYEWTLAEVSRRGLEENILLVGSYPLERMPSFYAHADALLVTLKSDPVFSLTIPGKVQSYMMSGTPILGMLDGEGARVIKEANAGFICNSGDSEGLASAVLDLLRLSPNERKQLGSNGLNYARREFSRSKLMNQLEDLLTKAINEKNKTML